MKRVINGKTYSKVLGIKQGSLLTAGKDGDIEEYKADPADAGKVLTVGEDGGVAPAEGSGGTLYQHNISLGFSSGSLRKWACFSIISTSNTPWTIDDIKSFLTRINATSEATAFNSASVGDVTAAAEAGSIGFLTGHILLDGVNVAAIGITLKLSDGSISKGFIYSSTIKDTVLPIT